MNKCCWFLWLLTPYKQTRSSPGRLCCRRDLQRMRCKTKMRREKNTLQGINISPPKWHIWRWCSFSLSVGYVSVPWRVTWWSFYAGDSLATKRMVNKKLPDTPQNKETWKPYRLRRVQKYWNWEDIGKIYPKQEFIGKTRAKGLHGLFWVPPCSPAFNNKNHLKVTVAPKGKEKNLLSC